MKALFAALVAFTLLAPMPSLAGGIVTPQQARQMQDTGEVVLVDIRSRQEWRASGIGEGVLTISMHERGFLEKLDEAVDGDRAQKIALICATGGRSAAVQRALAQHGFTNVLDVSQGMMGNSSGPGWIKSGLPVVRFQ